MDWKKIVIHHSGSPTTVRRGKDILPVNAALIREWHLAKGWNDIGYHFLILPDGRCEEGRSLSKAGAHCVAGHRNTLGIGVCLVGNFSQIEEVPKAQLNGLLKKVESLMSGFNLSLEDIELHREVPGAATECPGNYFPADIFRKELKDRLGL